MMYSLPQRQARAVNMSRDFVSIMVYLLFNNGTSNDLQAFSQSLGGHTLWTSE